MDNKRPLLSGEFGQDEDPFSAAPPPTRVTTGSSNTAALPPPPRDAAWAVAFKANLAFTLLSALYFGRTSFHVLSETDFDDDGNARRLSGNGGGGGLVALFCGLVVGLGWGFAAGLLHFIIRFAQEILKVAYLGCAALSGVAAVIALATGHWIAWIGPAILCAWGLRIFFRRQSRIRFSSANLKVAAIAVRSMPWTFRAALLMSGAQVLWFSLWAVAAGGSITSLRTVTAPDGTVYASSACRDVPTAQPTPGASRLHCECDGEIVSYNTVCDYDGGAATLWLSLFWLAGLSWVATVLQNVIAATVNGAVASWWFSPGDATPVRDSFYRATHGSLGSLCKAAAVTTVMTLVIKVVRRLSKAGRWSSYLVEWLRNSVEYVFSYAICFISIYGLSFSEAGHRVLELFKRRGITTIANDTVLDIGLTALVLGTTVAYLGAAYLLLLLAGSVLGGLGGILVVAVLALSWFVVNAIMATTIQVLRSSFRAVFVCFVQDPEALSKNHGSRVYDELSRAWAEMQRECPGMQSDPGHLGVQDV